MNSLPQELIDTVIDNLPLPSLFSSSLVAQQWRRRSQQRALERIKFLSEAQVGRWCTDFPQDPEGIVSYVHVAGFAGIYSWYDPTIFGRALKNLGSLTELWLSQTKIPDELPGQIEARGDWEGNYRPPPFMVILHARDDDVCHSFVLQLEGVIHSQPYGWIGRATSIPSRHIAKGTTRLIAVTGRCGRGWKGTR